MLTTLKLPNLPSSACQCFSSAPARESLDLPLVKRDICKCSDAEASSRAIFTVLLCWVVWIQNWRCKAVWGNTSCRKQRTAEYNGEPRKYQAVCPWNCQKDSSASVSWALVLFSLTELFLLTRSEEYNNTMGGKHLCKEQHWSKFHPKAQFHEKKFKIKPCWNVFLAVFGVIISCREEKKSFSLQVTEN